MPPTRAEAKTPFHPPKMAGVINFGIFQQINELVMGRPYAYDKNMRHKFAQMVKDQCYGRDFPILLDVDVGYTDSILTVTLNAIVVLDFDMDDFPVLEADINGNLGD